ncbi:hypothetical protein CVT24_004961 [Panaeolus cyanescens]|uniref:CCHC-type domain-containing protein n=1 Tax=Panaeolus cyanescens TaxID=181874 RepID=A0A409YB37_9AGAR|nr:hypothetical protein CVT24_004961 [Panaeolus cyanescens]
MPTHGTTPVIQADPPTSEAARTLKENEMLPSKVDPIVKSRTEALKTLKNANFIQKAEDVKTIRLLANAFFLFAAEPPKGQKRLDSSLPDRAFLEAVGRLLLGFALDPQEQVRSYIHEALETFADEVKATIREQCDKVISVTAETNSNVATLASETLQVSSTVKKSAEDVARTYCMVAAAPTAITHTSSPHFVQRPQVLNKQEKFDRQIMLKLNEDNPLLSPDLSDDDVARQVQEALSSLNVDKTHDTSLVSASRKSPRKDTVLLELKSRLTATWLRGEDRLTALATRLGAVVQDRTYQVMVRRIPLTFDEDICSPEAPAKIADENRLDPSAVRSVRWIKPAERRSEDQRTAYAMISLTTPQAANCLIRDGVFLNERRWHRPAVRSTKDAPRCLKCQHYGHLAKDCPNAETCGTCGAAHPTRGCKKLSTPWCVSCKSNNHSSWDRECPVFIAESRKLVRNNENDYVYFPTEEPWTWALKSNSGAAPPPPPPPPSAPQVQQRIAYRNNMTQGERKRQNKGKLRAPPPQGSQGATQPSHPPFLTTPNTVPFPSPGAGPSKWPTILPVNDDRPLPPLGQPYDPNIDWAEHPDDNVLTPFYTDGTKLRILQINLNKSRKAQLDLVNDPDLQASWDLILIQEPNINFYNHITTARGFRQVYPNARTRNELVVRSGIWVNEKISTNTWRALEIEGTADITAVQLSGPHHSLTVFSIYNDCNNSDSERALNRFMTRNRGEILGNGGHVLWGGDFNRHHPLWDNDEDHRLFTSQALSDAERLIQLLADWNMEMALPKGIRTLEHMRTKNLSRPDNVFCTDHTSHRVIKCDTVPELRPTNTDHFPIGTILDMGKVEITPERRRNFRLTDWVAFNEELTRLLSPLDTHTDLLTPVAFDDQVDALSSAINRAIESNTPLCNYTKYTKRWWSKELSQMRDQKQKLAWLHAKHAKDKDHPVHDEYRRTRNRYGEAIIQAKEEHWRAFLEEATEREMWVANGYIRSPVGDAGRVAVMHFSRRHTRGENGTGKVNLRSTAPPLIINGNTISVVEEYKYLGVLVDPELRWKQQTARAAEKAAKWILLFKRLTNSQKGMNSKLMRHLYRAVGIPKLTYALDVWYEPPNKPDGAENTRGSVRALRQIITVQKTATLAITGALKGTAADVLDPHAKVLPAEALLWYVCKRAYLRLCTLPTDHVLSQAITDAHCNRTKKLRHATPLERMAVLFDVNPKSTEKIPTVKPRHDLRCYLDTLSFPSREDSIAHEKADNAKVKVFTDGSGQDGHVGAAASIYINDMTNPVSTRHLYLGTIDSHSTYEAELVGVLLAMWLLITEAGHVLGRQPISVYTDNQSVIGALTSESRGPAEYLKDEIARLCAKYFPNIPFSRKVTVKWISAHSNVTGNEKIDFEAKQAAMGMTSRSQDLPRILRSPLPRSISALRQELKREAKEKANDMLKASPRWAQFRDLETDFDFANFHKAAEKLDRYKASVLVKIRTKHFPLNDYLHKRKIVQTNTCEQCETGARESLRHYILDCTKYLEQRNRMWTKAGRRYENIQDLLASPETATALVEYVDDSGRFPRRQTKLYQDNANAR